LKKVSILLLNALLIFNLILPSAVYALPDRPDAPDKPAAVDAPDLPDNYSDPDDEDIPPEEVVDEEVPTEPQGETNQDPVEELNINEDPDAPDLPDNYDGNNVTNDGQVGDVEIETGDATATGGIVNTGNVNVAADESTSEPEPDGITVLNEGNGTESDNSANIVLEDDSTTTQDNNANLDNSLNVDGNTGDNSASRNVGSSSIDTGDANVTGTIFNSVNTNVDGVSMSEFNIEDDHMGDYILDFESNCVTGCGNYGGVSASNVDNGSDSDNEIDLELLTNDAAFQNNDANIGNDLILTANSGNNNADNNTGGDNSIKTGDANISGNVVNIANNNFAGGVVYGVVNIFGDLYGDILLPEEYYNSYPTSDIALANIGNGSGSANSNEVDLVGLTDIEQFNTADIDNIIEVDANTGGNVASANTGGDSSIETGDVDVNVNVTNIANNNIIGENVWIVLVNEAGNWVGKIIGDAGSTITDFFALSSGLNGEENGLGGIDVNNTGNGTGSTNTADIDSTDQTEISQNNNAKIENNIVLDANTGNNSASRNTGGDNEIVTGDANVMLNVVNFVNNNVIGGKVFLTVVNVFGNWWGDFLAPGATKEAQADEETSSEEDDTTKGGIGGVADTSSSGNSNSSNSSSSSSSSSDSGSSSSNTGIVLAASNYTPSPVSTKGSKEAEDKLASADIAGGATIGDESSGLRINLAWLVLLLPTYLIARLVARTGLLAKAATLLKRS